MAAYAGHAVVSLRRDGLTGVHVLPRSARGRPDRRPRHRLRRAAVRRLRGGRAPNYVKPSRSGSGSSRWAAPATIFTTTPWPPGGADAAQADPGAPRARRAGLLRRRLRAGARLGDPAEDGTSVPLSIVRRADVPWTGPRPASSTATARTRSPSTEESFSIPRLSLLERGMVFASPTSEAAVRWAEPGTRRQAARQAEHVHRLRDCRRLSRPGGLDRWDPMVGCRRQCRRDADGRGSQSRARTIPGLRAAVPFVDSMPTILDPDLPLTVIEWDEWGDPLHDPAVYAYMKSYTPYENVRAVDYPAILATTSLNDTRVLLRGAGQVGGRPAAGRHQRRGPPDPAQDRDGGRARRGQRTLQGVAGERPSSTPG